MNRGRCPFILHYYAITIILAKLSQQGVKRLHPGLDFWRDV